MSPHVLPRRNLVAHVEEVLPQMGLAYAYDDEERLWGITRTMAGVPLDQLRQGERVRLTIEQHACFEVVTSWAVMD